MPTYNRADVAFDRGEGVYLYAVDGRRYLDFACGIAVTGLGHAHPHLVKAVCEQAQKVWHTSNLFRIPLQEQAAKRLVEQTFADTVFFTNSGAEALECVIKTIRKYHSAAGNPQRWRIVTFEGAFHGRTLATIAAGGQTKHLEGFGPKVDGFDQVPFGDHEALEKAIGPETAGILIELIQGEGGIRVVPPQCLRGLRELADKHGLLLAFDEVQTGMGRTGKLFAHEWVGVTPDVMGVAKALGGGFPVGACLATAQAASGMTAGAHGSTYGGNPLAMAAANAVLDIMLADGFMEHVQQMSSHLGQALAGIVDHNKDVFEESRGAGLLRGLKCRPSNTEVCAAFRARGLLTPTAGDNVVRIVPPLIVQPEHIQEATAMIEAACADLRAARPKAAAGG
ncbi:MAG TPA: aspartate aminotransferase family protein [Alphaproteobacteria bacterium]|nr:aspartate aminotransferase family protein [Alphaproteobacteria bacterium]